MSKKPRKPASRDDTILKIHRLFDQPLPATDEEQCPWYCRPRSIVDCNALLSIADDDGFIDAAAWQIQGREIAGRQRCRWRERLRRSSRMSVVIGMRFKTAGRRQAVRIPGLWLAFFLDPPGRKVFGERYVGPILDSIRHKFVAWRFRRLVKKSTTKADIPLDVRGRDLQWRQTS